MKPQKTYEITLASIENVTLFNIRGEMTASAEPLFQDTCKQAIGLQPRKIIFNFNGCTYFTSAGIAVFIQILAHALKRDQLIGITGLNNHFTKIFSMLGITKFAKIHDSVQTAMENLNA